MKRVVAQFKPPWRPSRLQLAGLALLAALTLASLCVFVWQQQRVAELRTQLVQLAEADRAGILPAAPRPTPAYDASARQFLKERAAGWAPMLRTLESGAMIGVTPSAVEFNAEDGVARVTLNYTDSTALLDYLGRINEGVSPSRGVARWTLVETRMSPESNPTTAPGGAGAPPVGGVAQSVATIRSVWPDAEQAVSRDLP